MHAHFLKHRYMFVAVLVFSLISVQFSQRVNAHEYWIEPLDFTPALDVTASADLRVGQDFKGDRLFYLSVSTLGYQITDANGTRELKGRNGDRPALSFPAQVPGLNIISYQTNRNRVRFDNWEKFETYLRKQGMPQIIDRHHERGLPETGFWENYSRYVKSLLAVGGQSGGSDVEIGMRTELIALTNPYTLSTGEKLLVQLLFEGVPVPDQQVSVFIRSQTPGEEQFFERHDLRTDENGQVMLEVLGGHRYLLNSISMIEVEESNDAVWESFWASLTFEVPG